MLFRICPLVSPTDPNVSLRYDISPDTQIYLNGSLIKLSELKAGDDIKIASADGALANVVEATRSKSGIVLSCADGVIDLTTDYLDKIPFHLANGANATLNGKPTQLNDLRSGDLATVGNRQDRTNYAFRRDQRSLVGEILEELLQKLI